MSHDQIDISHSTGGDQSSEHPVDAETDPRFDVPLRGVDVDAATRCAHYREKEDVVAIRFPCCDIFYPCHACHNELADHEPKRWPSDQFDTPAILCGRCKRVLTIQAYLEAEHTCPACGTGFNPGCVRHHDRYFEIR